tara:strand:- start:3219 stop:3443 length:225 start_codon:yes stop_codon:yes gene_type:complete
MKRIPKTLIILLIFFLPTKAYAYLDPGTGSIILQAILGFIAAAVASVSIYWTKFKLLLNKIFNKKKQENDTKNK